MSYNFALSRFLDELRKKNRINYYDYVKYRGMADTLESENAELRARLEKAVELPAKVGDIVYAIVGVDYSVEEFTISSIEIKYNSIWVRMVGTDFNISNSFPLELFGVRWFTELEKSKEKLAELKGEKK